MFTLTVRNFPHCCQCTIENVCRNYYMPPETCIAESIEFLPELFALSPPSFLAVSCKHGLGEFPKERHHKL